MQFFENYVFFKTMDSVLKELLTVVRTIYESEGSVRTLVVQIGFNPALSHLPYKTYL